MASPLMKMRAKFFSDQRALLNRIDKKNRRVLIRTGAYGKGIVKRSMKKAPRETMTVLHRRRDGTLVARNKRLKRYKSSPPGSPPFVRKGQLKRFTDYYLGETGRSVVVGPYKLPSKTRSSKPVPQVLEEGGTVVYPRRYSASRRSRRRQAARGAAGSKPIVIKIAARPYIKPSLPPSAKKMGQFLRER